MYWRRAVLIGAPATVVMGGAGYHWHTLRREYQVSLLQTGLTNGLWRPPRPAPALATLASALPEVDLLRGVHGAGVPTGLCLVTGPQGAPLLELASVVADGEGPRWTYVDCSAVNSVWETVEKPFTWSFLPHEIPTLPDTVDMLCEAMGNGGISGAIILDMRLPSVTPEPHRETPHTATHTQAHALIAAATRACTTHSVPSIILAHDTPEPLLGTNIGVPVRRVRVADLKYETGKALFASACVGADESVNDRVPGCENGAAGAFVCVWPVVRGRWGDIISGARSLCGSACECAVAPVETVDGLEAAPGVSAKVCVCADDQLAAFRAKATEAPMRALTSLFSTLPPHTLPPEVLFETLMFLSRRRQMAAVVGLGDVDSEPEPQTLFDLTHTLSSLWGKDPKFSVWIQQLLSDGWVEQYPHPDNRYVQADGRWAFVDQSLCDRHAVIGVRPLTAAAFTDILDGPDANVYAELVTRMERRIQLRQLLNEYEIVEQDAVLVAQEYSQQRAIEDHLQSIADSLDPNTVLLARVDLLLRRGNIDVRQREVDRRSAMLRSLIRDAEEE